MQLRHSLRVNETSGAEVLPVKPERTNSSHSLSKPKAGTGSRNHGGGGVLAGSLRLMLSKLSLHRTNCLGMFLPTVGRVLLHCLIIKTLPHRPTTVQSDLHNHLIEAFLSDNSRMCVKVRIKAN